MCPNWEIIVKQYEKDIDSVYLDSTGASYRFVGLLHGSDDYYYCMVDLKTLQIRLCSCVGSLTGDTGHGFCKLKD